MLSSKTVACTNFPQLFFASGRSKLGTFHWGMFYKWYFYFDLIWLHEKVYGDRRDEFKYSVYF